MANGIVGAPELVIGAPGPGAGIAAGIGDVFGNANNLLQTLMLNKIKQQQEMDFISQQLAMKNELARQDELARQQELLAKGLKFSELIKTATTPEARLGALFESGLGTEGSVNAYLASRPRELDPIDQELKRDLLKARAEEARARSKTTGQPKPPPEPTPLQNFDLIKKVGEFTAQYGIDRQSPSVKQAISDLRAGNVEKFNDFFIVVQEAQAFRKDVGEFLKNKGVVKRLTPEELEAAQNYSKLFKKDPVGAFKTTKPILDNFAIRIRDEDAKAAQAEALRRKNQPSFFDSLLQRAAPTSLPTGLPSPIERR